MNKTTGQTVLDQIKSAGRFLKLGRRQRRRMKEACDNKPTQFLEVVYKNGMRVRYKPLSVAGQLLVCEAYISTPELPQETTEHDVAISRYEFTGDAMKKLFDQYHAALMGGECLRWESDGKAVTSGELLGEQLEVGPVSEPEQSDLRQPGGMGRTS